MASKTRADWYSEREPNETITVHEQGRSEWTGLYDHNGAPIARKPMPFGFQPSPQKPKRRAR